MFSRFLPLTLLISALALCSCFETGQQRPHLTAPSPAAVHKSVDKLEQHIDKASDNTKALKTTLAKAVALAGENKELRVTLELANGQIDTLSAELLGAKGEVGVLRAANADLEKKVGAQTDYANARADEANAAILDRDAAKFRYHRLKFYACSLAAAAAFLLLWKFKGVLAFLGPYGIAALIGGPAAVFGIAWLTL